MDGYQFSDATLMQIRPHRLELHPIGQLLTNLDRRVRLGVPSLGHQVTVLESCHYLPLHDTTLLQPLGSMLADDVLSLGDELPDRVEKLSRHHGASSNRSVRPKLGDCCSP